MLHEEGHKHEASGAVLWKDLANPHVETFAECFSLHTFNKDEAPAPRRIEGIGSCGPWCSRHAQDGRYSSLYVSAADWVLSRCKELLVVPEDQLYFQIIDHTNGWSLVTLQYNTIIGSRWLAYIRTDSIPREAVSDA